MYKNLTTISKVDKIVNYSQRNFGSLKILLGFNLANLWPCAI